MRNLSILAMCLLVMSTHAQSVFTNQTNAALQKVIADYPNRFKNIIGTATGNSSQEYNSTIRVQGGGPAYVQLKSANNGGAYSWRSELYQNESFVECSQQLKQVFQHIKNTIIRIEGYPPFILSGVYDSPSSDKVNFMLPFQLLPNTNGFQQLKVDLLMEHSSGVWKLWLRVYDGQTIDIASN
ncbi:MAG: hypothetical protein K2P88_02965 [Chitinophagaceae bacterium]|uniref:hypothetical protein n=1 Tax=unclassified Paraflavitalea TaxID=2798305 RepID=UPI003D33E8BD|nr:hypothetical protein [Chitinophagaceae bacterium]